MLTINITPAGLERGAEAPLSRGCIVPVTAIYAMRQATTRVIQGGPSLGSALPRELYMRFERTTFYLASRCSIHLS